MSSLDANLALSDYNVALAWAAGGRDQRWGVNRFPPNYPLGIFRCKQGWIGVTVVTPVQWKTFCQMLGMPDLAGDPRFAINRGRLRDADEIEARFAQRFFERTAEEWFALALEQRMPLVVVPDMADLLTSHEHRRRNTFVPVTHGGRSYEMPVSPLRLSATPPRAGGAVPALGEGKRQWRKGAQAQCRRRPRYLKIRSVRSKDCASSIYRWVGRARWRRGIWPISAETLSR